MSEEIKQDLQEADQVEEKEEAKVETPEAEAVEETVEAEEKSPYQEELERIEAEKKALEAKYTADLEAEKDKRRMQNEAKDRALQAEKEKTRSVKESWKQETLSEMDRRLEIRDARSRAARITNDPTAHKVIMHHYESLPDSLRSKSLDPDVAVEENLQTALALANRRKVASMLYDQNSEDMQSSRAIRSMGGAGLPSNSSFSRQPSTVEKQTAKLLQMYAGNNKELAKRLISRNGQK